MSPRPDDASEVKTSHDVRKEVLEEDASKDVNFNLGVLIAVVSGVSSAAAVLAVLSVKFLQSFRQDLDNLWLACVPLCFSFITGVGVAYRKNLADVGIHLAMVVGTLMAGGAGYGLSITPVYLDRRNCTLTDSQQGGCNKEVLTIIYFYAGAVASGFGALGLLVSLCACSNAMKRRSLRERYRQMRLAHEEKVGKQAKIRSNLTSHTPMTAPNGKQNVFPPPVQVSCKPNNGPLSQTVLLERQKLGEEAPYPSEHHQPDIYVRQSLDYEKSPNISDNVGYINGDAQADMPGRIQHSVTPATEEISNNIGSSVQPKEACNLLESTSRLPGQSEHVVSPPNVSCNALSNSQHTQANENDALPLDSAHNDGKIAKRKDLHPAEAISVSGLEEQTKLNPKMMLEAYTQTVCLENETHSSSSPGVGNQKHHDDMSTHL